MRHINGVYTQSFNRRHGKVGHLFQGRFKAVLVDADTYFLEVCRYVDLNPLRAGLVPRPDDWAWSSYRALVGLNSAPSWLNRAAVYKQLAPRAPQRDGPARYAEHVAQGQGVKLWDEALTGQIYLGGPAFVARMQAKLEVEAPREVPSVQRRRPPQPLADYLANADRDAGIASAFLEGGHTQTAIAQAAGLSVSRISRLIALCEGKGKT